MLPTVGVCTSDRRDTRPHDSMASIEWMLANTGDGVHTALCILSPNYNGITLCTVGNVAMDVEGINVEDIF